MLSGYYSHPEITETVTTAQVLKDHLQSQIYSKFKRMPQLH